MPPIMKYYPPGDPNRVAAVGLEGDIALRGRWYDQVRQYYDGHMTKFLDVKEDEPDDNVILNKVKQVVDRTVAFLFPDVPDFELDPDVSGKTPDEEWLEEAWLENGGIALLHDMAYIGSLSGDIYVRIMPPDAQMGDIYPQILVLDPKSVQTFWKSDDIRRVVFHEVTWTVQEGNRQLIDYALDFVNYGTYWELIQYQNGGGLNAWHQVGETVRWNSTLPPIIHSKHLPNPRNYYGNSEFTQSQLVLNDKINLVASENNRINRYHASPKTVATGTTAESIQETAIDEMWAVENPDAKVYNLEMTSDLQGSLSQQQLLSREFLAESRVVILQGTVKDFQRVTNAGVRTVFIDQLQKNAILRWNYGKLLQMISMVLLYLGKKSIDKRPTIVFTDPLPTDQTETANVAALERQMNIVSRQTLSSKRGYDWPTELAKMEEEKTLDVFVPPAPASNGGNNQPQSAPTDAASRLKKEPGSVSNQ